MDRAVIQIIDEVNIKIKGLSERTLEELSDLFAVFSKGYRFQVKYKLGHWDGKIRFFKVDKARLIGSCYVKLLPEIISHLNQGDHIIKIEDNRSSIDLTVPLVDKNYFKDKGYDIVFGKHQVRGINALLSESGGIFEGGTGCGKTIMTAALCQIYEDNLNFKCIIIVPTADLITQTYNELVLYGTDCGRYSGDDKDINHVHLVSTWQALQNNKGLIGQYQVVIVDECHGVTGQVLQEILNDYGANCYLRLGLTGTLPEEEIDMMAVRITLGEVVEKVEVSELILNGWLAMLKIYCYELIEDVREEYHTFCENNPKDAADLTYKQFKVKCFPDFQSEKKYLQKKPERLEFLAKLITLPEGNTMVMVPNVEFGRRISKLIPNSVFFYGKDSKKIRQELYASFDKRNDLIAITTFQLASTGLNIKRIFNLFLIDGGKSFVQIIQSIGRGLRKAKDKDKIRVYDVHSDFKYCKRHAISRKKHYTKKKYPYKQQKVDYLGLGA